jgi:hypothetical protein
VLEPFLGMRQYARHGRRVVEGQRLMQAASDIMLGWAHERDQRVALSGLHHDRAR